MLFIGKFIQRQTVKHRCQLNDQIGLMIWLFVSLIPLEKNLLIQIYSITYFYSTKEKLADITIN